MLLAETPGNLSSTHTQAQTHTQVLTSPEQRTHLLNQQRHSRNSSQNNSPTIQQRRTSMKLESMSKYTISC